MRPDDFLGLCPVCRQEPTILHASPESQWAVCIAHGRRWHLGSPFSPAHVVVPGYDYDADATTLAEMREQEPVCRAETVIQQFYEQEVDA